MAETGKFVLMVDDDKLPMQFYVRALTQQGYEVKLCLEPDSALDFAVKERSNICAIILDVMMPPGKAYKDKDTDQGLHTGLFLFRDLRKLCEEVPVIVLTNVRNPVTLGEFSEGPLLKVAQKMDFPPFELAGLVDAIVTKDKD
ncbi:response regulator [Candidatus Pacearchaeota archaeon]|nr:response regulator [Candidatus Pacearchaeota archaeon]